MHRSHLGAVLANGVGHDPEFHLLTDDQLGWVQFGEYRLNQQFPPAIHIPESYGAKVSAVSLPS